MIHCVICRRADVNPPQPLNPIVAVAFSTCSSSSPLQQIPYITHNLASLLSLPPVSSSFSYCKPCPSLSSHYNTPPVVSEARKRATPPSPRSSFTSVAVGPPRRIHFYFISLPQISHAKLRVTDAARAVSTSLAVWPTPHSEPPRCLASMAWL